MEYAATFSGLGGASLGHANIGQNWYAVYPAGPAPRADGVPSGAVRQPGRPALPCLGAVRGHCIVAGTCLVHVSPMGYRTGMGTSVEPPDRHSTRIRAAALAGVHRGTLRRQVYRKKLRAEKFVRDLVTTRRWLHEYLLSREGSRGARAAPLPEGYVPPEGPGT